MSSRNLLVLIFIFCICVTFAEVATFWNRRDAWLSGLLRLSFFSTHLADCKKPLAPDSTTLIFANYINIKVAFVNSFDNCFEYVSVLVQDNEGVVIELPMFNSYDSVQGLLELSLID
jgi:hypothetical protein